MKLLLTICFLQLCSYCFSQCPPIQYGAINFKDSPYAIDSLRNGTVKKRISYSKWPVNSDLKDVRYKKDSTNKGNGKFFYSEPCTPHGLRTSCSNDTGECYFTAYYPKGFDTSCRLPCIALFHGGGFSDCKAEGDAGVGNTVFVAREVAKRGYVAFVVEYRTGRYLVPGGRYVSAQQILAQYRAIQDARGALRWIITRERNHAPFAGEPFRIDTTKIFIGGNSAGSIIAIHTAYYDSTQIRQVFPSPPGLPTIKDVLGSVDADYYKGDSTIDLTRRIRGVMNMWGQASFPVSYRNNLKAFWENNAKIPPIVSFHGLLDKTLPPDTTGIVYPPATTAQPYNYIRYHKESACLKNGLTYVLDSIVATPDSTDVLGVGSLKLHEIFGALGITRETYIDCDMGHGIDSIWENFGLTGINTLSDLDSVYRYLVQRTMTVFQAVLTVKESLLMGTKLFNECVNERVKSTPNSQFADNIGNCPGSNNPCPPDPGNFIPDDTDDW